MFQRSKLIAALLAGAVFACGSAQASFSINATVGGAPMGANYVNFDNLPLGPGAGSSGGLGVSFISDGSVVTGASSGVYAAPYISNSNATLFGDLTVSGVDTTNYLSTGIGQLELTFPASELYLGLLWGSVDLYNRLEFFLGSSSVGIVSGGDIFGSANGDQGLNGTYYANIVSSMPFDRVVASSTQYAFEIDNVAYNSSDPLPEPLSLGLVGFGLLGIGLAMRRKGAKP
ncbi:MAG: Npun_F0296 family exosortase-dependent surface protein [Rhodospirillaceae bacterium]